MKSMSLNNKSKEENALLWSLRWQFVNEPYKYNTQLFSDMKWPQMICHSSKIEA